MNNNAKIVKYIISAENSIRMNVCHNNLSKESAQRKMKELTERAKNNFAEYVVKATKNTLMFKYFLRHDKAEYWFFKVVTTNNIPLNPKEVRELQSKLFK